MNNATGNKDQVAYLRLMLDAFEKIRFFIGGMSYDNFLIDSKTQSAVIMQLQTEDIADVEKEIKRYLVK